MQVSNFLNFTTFPITGKGGRGEVKLTQILSLDVFLCHLRKLNPMLCSDLFFRSPTSVGLQRDF